MKMKKLLIAILCVACAATALIGCSQGATESPVSSEESVFSQESENSSEEESSPNEESSSEDGEWGGWVPLP